jgi:Cellulase (glycosyl hydrolase family 5)
MTVSAKIPSRRVAGYLLAALALLAGVWPLAGPAQPAAAYGTGCAHAVVKPVGPFHIASDHRTVVDAKGRTFISYGTTVPGLSNPNLTRYPGADRPKIDATADVWCGNTVRLQVSQYAVTHNTTPDNGGCENTYLNNALDPEVRRAENDGLVVVINDQTESDRLANSEKDPTKATFAFWNCVTRHHENWGRHKTYAQDQQVIFDIFNEPRVDACPAEQGGHGPNGPYFMNLWRNGTVTAGNFAGCGQNGLSYQGMDAVAYQIRHDDKAKNLLWVEGPGTGNTLAGLAGTTCGSTPTGSCLISPNLGPIVYSVHHPYANPVAGKNPPADPATWGKEFGWVVDHTAPAGVAPVVVGEWTNFPWYGHVTNRPYCWPDAPSSVKDFLSYLQTLRVGLNAYQLSAPPTGYLLKVNGDWTDTTNYTDATWKSSYCTTSGAPLLGPGSDIRHWFQQRD